MENILQSSLEQDDSHQGVFLGICELAFSLEMQDPSRGAPSCYTRAVLNVVIEPRLLGLRLNHPPVKQKKTEKDCCYNRAFDNMLRNQCHQRLHVYFYRRAPACSQLILQYLVKFCKVTPGNLLDCIEISALKLEAGVVK